MFCGGFVWIIVVVCLRFVFIFRVMVEIIMWRGDLFGCFEIFLYIIFFVYNVN